MSLVVVGSVALDNIITPKAEMKNVLGGSACYFSCSAGYFTDVSLVGVVGSDFPSCHIEFLKQKNIDITGLEIVNDGKTFTWTGKYNDDLSVAETLSVSLNVFADFNPVLPESYKKAEHVFLANIDPDLQIKVLESIDSPKLVIMDTMNIWIENKKDSLKNALKKIDVLVINEDEARMLTEKKSLLDAGKCLLDMGPKKVVIKKGADGSFLLSEDDYFCIPAYPVSNVVDTTGAGDSFAGGMVGYLTKTGDYSDSNFRRAIVFGTVMSSFTVEDFSLKRLADIKKDEIEERFETFKSFL